MHRAIPVGNRLCAKRVEERKGEIHRKKLSQVKTQIDASEPRSCAFDHLRQNWKREQQLEDRYAEIDRCNALLLTKMAEIMRSSPPPERGGTPRTQTPRPGDTRGDGKGTLNKNYRKKELHRITAENQRILRRIQQAPPTYDHVAWEESHRKQEVLLRKVCEHPMVIRTPRSVTPRGAAPGKPPRPGATPSAPEEPEPGVLFAGAVPIAGQDWSVELWGGRQGELRIRAFTGEDREPLELELEQREHRRYYREAGGDYKVLAARLAVHDGRLVVEPLAQSESAPAALLTYDDVRKRSGSGASH